jgi:hypothetical protein
MPCEEFKVTVPDEDGNLYCDQFIENFETLEKLADKACNDPDPVLSVTGDLVDNTDPANPVVNFPSQLDTLQFNTLYSITGSEPQGSVFWNEDRETLSLQMNGTRYDFGLGTYFYIKNQSGVQINAGEAVGFAGTLGMSGILLGSKYLNDGSQPSKIFMGIAKEDIPDGQDGKITFFGEVRGINTSAFSDGDLLYTSTTLAGALVATQPSAPSNKSAVAAVVSSGNNGTIFVRSIPGIAFSELDDVQLSNLQVGEVPRWNGTTWVNASAGSLFGGSNGDILLHNGTLFEPVEHREALRSKVPFEKSPVAPPIGSWTSLIFWDNFRRPNENPVITSDSGGTYTNLVGDGIRIENNVVRFNADGNIVGIPCSPKSFLCRITKTSNVSTRFYVWKDAQNYYEIELQWVLNQLNFNKNIAGVFTQISSQPMGAILNYPRQELKYIFGYIDSNPFSSIRFLYLKVENTGQIFTQIVNTDGAIFDNQLTFAGFGGTANFSDKTTSVFLNNIDRTNIP